MAESAQQRDEPVSKSSRTSSTLFFALVLFVWILATPLFLLWALEPIVTFFGETATDAEKAETAFRSDIVAFVAAGLGVATAAYAAWLRRSGWAVVYCCLALATAVVFFSLGPSEDPAPPPSPGPDYTPCYSGSNDCPGG